MATIRIEVTLDVLEDVKPACLTAAAVLESIKDAVADQPTDEVVGAGFHVEIEGA